MSTRCYTPQLAWNLVIFLIVMIFDSDILTAIIFVTELLKKNRRRIYKSIGEKYTSEMRNAVQNTCIYSTSQLENYN